MNGNIETLVYLIIAQSLGHTSHPRVHYEELLVPSIEAIKQEGSGLRFKKMN